jgi:hypothetical protein
VETVEIGHVADPDLEEIIEISRDHMAIEDDRQPTDCVLELCKALGRRTIKYHPDHDKGAAIDPVRYDLGPNTRNVTVGEQALSTAVTGGRTHIHPFRQFSVTKAAISLQEAENILVDPVKLGGDGHFFHYFRYYFSVCIIESHINDYNSKITANIESTFQVIFARFSPNQPL